MSSALNLAEWHECRSTRRSALNSTRCNKLLNPLSPEPSRFDGSSDRSSYPTCDVETFATSNNGRALSRISALNESEPVFGCSMGRLRLGDSRWNLARREGVLLLSPTFLGHKAFPKGKNWEEKFYSFGFGRNVTNSRTASRRSLLSDANSARRPGILFVS